MRYPKVLDKGWETMCLAGEGTRRECGVDDGFRIAPDSSPHQQYQQDSSANHSKTGQTIRKSATGCNQESDDEDSTPFKGDKV
jgi:hypothetical protein